LSAGLLDKRVPIKTTKSVARSESECTPSAIRAEDLIKIPETSFKATRKILSKTPQRVIDRIFFCLSFID